MSAEATNPTVWCRCQIPYDQLNDGMCARCRGRIPTEAERQALSRLGRHSTLPRAQIRVRDWFHGERVVEVWVGDDCVGQIPATAVRCDISPQGLSRVTIEVITGRIEIDGREG